MSILPTQTRRWLRGRDVGVFGMEQLVIDRDEVFAALRLGYRFEEFVPALRKDVSRAAVVVPVDLATTQEEDPAQDQLSDARRKCFGVGDGQRGTPGPPKTIHLSIERCSRRASMSASSLSVVFTDRSAPSAT